MRLLVGGFAFIECAAVIVILMFAIATIAPRFIQHANANDGKELQEVAKALTSASSLNHAANLAYDARLTAERPVTVSSCSDIEKLLSKKLSSNFVVEEGKGLALDGDGLFREGGMAECRLAYDSSGSGKYDGTDKPVESFIAYGVKN